MWVLKCTSTILFSHGKDVLPPLNPYTSLVSSQNIIFSCFVEVHLLPALSLISPYFTDVEPVDFQQPQETANAINVWCANITRNRITDIVTSG